MKKRIAALVLCLALVFALAACGEAGGDASGRFLAVGRGVRSRGRRSNSLISSVNRYQGILRKPLCLTAKR